MIRAIYGPIKIEISNKQARILRVSVSGYHRYADDSRDECETSSSTVINTRSFISSLSPSNIFISHLASCAVEFFSKGKRHLPWNDPACDHPRHLWRICKMRSGITRSLAPFLSSFTDDVFNLAPDSWSRAWMTKQNPNEINHSSLSLSHLYTSRISYPTCQISRKVRGGNSCEWSATVPLPPLSLSLSLFSLMWRETWRDALKRASDSVRLGRETRL